LGVTALADRVSVAWAVADAFTARDEERLLSLSTPDAVFRTRVDVIGEPTFSGHDGIRAWLAAVDEKYDRYEIADAEYRQGAGDAVFVSCRLRLRFAGDRYGMSRMVYWVFLVDENLGCVYGFTSFRDCGEALAAAGLS
jgi:ketosteroid isomerase-like protein